MAFKLTTRTVEEVTVIDLSGRLDLAEGSSRPPRGIAEYSAA